MMPGVLGAGVQIAWVPEVPGVWVQAVGVLGGGVLTLHVAGVCRVEGCWATRVQGHRDAGVPGSWLPGVVGCW